MADTPRCSSVGWSGWRLVRRQLFSATAEQTMDFVHVRDVARANILGAKSDVSDEVFNVASGTETSLRATGAVAHVSDGSEWA